MYTVREKIVKPFKIIRNFISLGETTKILNIWKLISQKLIINLKDVDFIITGT